MSPDKIAFLLRQIANNIDISKHPSRALVSADLRRLIVSFTDEDQSEDQGSYESFFSRNGLDVDSSVYDLLNLGEGVFEQFVSMVLKDDDMESLSVRIDSTDFDSGNIIIDEKLKIPYVADMGLDDLYTRIEYIVFNNYGASVPVEKD